MILGEISDLKEYLLKRPVNSKIGFVDTSILFSASYTPDKFNEHSEKAFEDLAKTKTPIVTNQNVRSEYVYVFNSSIFTDRRR